MIEIKPVTEYQAKQPYKFKDGNVVSPRHIVKFVDGTIHNLNDKLLITKETEAYYHVCEKSYEFA